ncbi:MAG: class I SAM-dependent methyltransferase [Chloroflexota bacterium]|nr:class I SAM-dependent methyltransferase [Chloroflexota bacterium]
MRGPLAEVFRDRDVAKAYRHRAPYPDETFTILEELLVDPRTVLDAGSGSGALARSMVRFASRVDAVDPSAAMVGEGRLLAGGDDPRLRWITGTAEDAPLDPPYGLITAGTSIHWMDPQVVMPRFAAALAAGAHLAIVERDDGDFPVPELLDIIKRYSELHADRVDALPERIAALEATGRFVREGERRTAPVGLRRTVDEYLEYLHSTSTLARVRLGERASAFDADVRAVFAKRGMAIVEQQVVGLVAWGRPR